MVESFQAELTAFQLLDPVTPEAWIRKGVVKEHN